MKKIMDIAKLNRKAIKNFLSVYGIKTRWYWSKKRMKKELRKVLRDK